MRRWWLATISIVFALPLARADGTASAPAAAADMFGSWKIDSALTHQQGDSSTVGNGAAPASSADSSHRGGGRHGGGMDSEGGMGGGGGMGGHGGRGGGGRSGSSASASGAGKQNPEEREPGLARAFATQVTITALAKRIRFDDGEHIVELDKDGTNVSGPGVGGTVALTSMQPDIVVETLTDSGYAMTERYRVADDGRHLQMRVTLKQPGTDRSREFVRVFDRIPADAGAATPANPSRQ
jgi:hypothetical protein